MTYSRICRFVVTFATVLFAGMAGGIWAAPGEAARYLGLEVVRPAGAAAVRAELGGLFAGLTVLCAAAAWTRRLSWSLGAASILAGIVLGRSIGWIGNGAIGSDLVAMVAEIIVMASLIGLAPGARSIERSPLAATSDSVGRKGPTRLHGSSRWRLAVLAGTLLALPAIGAAALMSDDLQQRIFDRGAEHQAAKVNTAPLEDDALRVAICGSSAPLASAERAKPCVAVFAGGKFYVVDAGPESVENLVQWVYRCRRSAACC